jgi:hypothetical protein
MFAVPVETIRQVIAILGAEGITEGEVEARVAALVQDNMVARRLIDWIPEAFGFILVSHTGKFNLPTSFSAKAADGRWVKFDFKTEPIFGEALQLGAEMYHSGPRNLFGSIALRSSMVAAVNNALNAGASLEGSTLSGPAVIGIPAETYGDQRKFSWRRLFRPHREG